MSKKLIFVLVAVAGIFLFLISCNNRKEQNMFLGKWNLIFWNNELQEGTFVFKDSVVYFNMNFSTEIGNYEIKKDTLRVNRTGGSMTYLSGYDYWIIEKVDSIFFKLVSDEGNVVTAFRKSKFQELQNSEKALDTVVIQL